MSKFINTIFYISLFLMTSCSQKNEKGDDMKGHDHSEVKSHYTCSMHPQVKEDKPGKCPICHMNLTKVESGSQEQKSSKVEQVLKDVANIKLRQNQLSHFHPSFFTVTQMKMNKEIRLLGSVLQSEDKESNIPARIGGRVERVFIKSAGSSISVGEAVLDFYSPKLITAGEEYIIARKSFEKTNNKEFRDMLSQSEERLKLWGVKDSQYEEWYKVGKIPKAITIFSQATGIVRKKNAITGKYFNEGENFFELSDLSEVWVELDVYEQDAALIKNSQKVSMEFSALPGEIYEGEIDFINPILDTNSRTLKVRTTIKNTSGKLRPGMVADANLLIDFEGSPLVIPRTAIIDTGKRKVVWVKDSKVKFRAKTILTGYESHGYVEVKEGLDEGEDVVIEGNFLLDAQAQLTDGYE